MTGLASCCTPERIEALRRVHEMNAEFVLTIEQGVCIQPAA